MKKIFLQCFGLFSICGYATAQENRQDMEDLKAINKQFIRNFLNDDTVAHNQIIHENFVCIESSGKVVTRAAYMKAWASDFRNSGYTSFTCTDETIRIFGNMALIRAVTPYTKIENGKTVHGATIYTDTYIKENGRWWCVQAHMTPVR